MRDDPFAKLGALDQKLFQPAAPSPSLNGPALGNTPVSEQPVATKPEVATPSTASTEGREVGKEGKREVGKEGSRGTSSNQPVLSVPTFDLNVKPYRKDSYLFTDEEFEAIEDIKIELRRSYDLKATKNDIARCAVGHLLTDFKRNGETSAVVHLLRTKK